MVNTAPIPVDVVDFQFKLRYRLKVFQNAENEAFAETSSLVASASRFGLLFIGTCNPCFQVLQLQSLNKYTAKDGDIADYNRRTIPLQSRPKHLSVNCDCTKLCVVTEKDDCAKAIIFDVTSFLKQNVSVVQEIRLSPTPGVFVIETCWNPGMPSVLSVCKSDGSLGVYELKETGIEITEMPPSSGATCMCWSPKGKQVAVGSTDGKITQYKPDLKVARVINAPVLEGAQSVLAVQWISNFQFVAVYKSSNPDVQLNMIVVDCPRVGDTVYTNYEDICYSYGNARPHQFYLLLQPVWNVLMVASSNSMELGVLAFEKNQWTQWILLDSARAELPLSSTKQETLPVGLALDTSSSEPYPWGEATLPPMPLVFLLSHHGTLCCFNAINAKKDTESICKPPEQLTDPAGASQFTTMLTVPRGTPVVITPVKQMVQQPTAVSQTFPFNQPSNVQQASKATVNQQPQLIFGMKPAVNQTTIKPVQQLLQSPFSLVNTVSSPKPEPPQPLLNLKSVEQAENLVKQQQKPPPAAVKQPAANDAKSNAANIPQKTNQFQPAEVTVLNEDTEKLIAQMVKEECATLEVELLALLERGRELKVDMGSDGEATNLVQDTNSLEDFVNEATETSSSQAAEVHGLKQSLIQTWVWYEEARSRFATFKDPKLIALMRAQPLDPASERQLADIRHLFYYIESQLNQANVALDEQWESFQDSCKKKLHLRMPSIETIYQSMVKQNATLQKQTYILKDISNRVRRKHRDYQIPHLLVCLENADGLEEQLRNLHFQPSSVFHLQHERVLKRQKLLSKAKSGKLTNLLLNRKVVHVSVSKPQTLNASLQLNSLIGEPFSPIGGASKKLQPQKLDFVQSTPKAFMKPEPKTLITSTAAAAAKVPVTSEVTKSQNFNLNKAASSPSVSAWAPNTNSLEVSSKSAGSAFVPTTQTVSFGIKPTLFSSNNQLIATAKSPPVTTAEQQQKFFFSLNPTTSTLATTTTTTSTKTTSSSTSSTNVFTAPVSSSSSTTTNEQKTFFFKRTTAPTSTPFSFQTVAADATPKTSPSFTGFNFSANQNSLLKIPAGPPNLTKTSSSAPAFVSQMMTGSTVTTPSEDTVTLATVRSATTTTGGIKPLLSDPQVAPAIFGGSVQTSKSTASFPPSSSGGGSNGGGSSGGSSGGGSSGGSSGGGSSGGGSSGGGSSGGGSSGGGSSGGGSSGGGSSGGGSSGGGSSGGGSSGGGSSGGGSSGGGSSGGGSSSGSSATVITDVIKETPVSAPASAEVPSATETTPTPSKSIFTLGDEVSLTPVATSLTAGSIFSIPSAMATTASSSSIFGGGIGLTTKSSIFGNGSAFSSSTTTPTTPVFGKTTASSSFGGGGNNQIFAASTTTSAPIFGSASKPIFGGSTTSAFSTLKVPVFAAPPTSSSNIFGATTTAASIFGGPTTSPSIFAVPIPPTTTTTTTTAATVFGTSTAASSGFGTSTTPSIFGATSPSVFGTTSTTSIFGAAPTTSVFTSPTTSVFSMPPTTTTATASVFGATATSTTGGNIFGTPTTSAPSVFGTPTTAAPTVFGGTPTATTGISIFGTPTTVFGTPATSSAFSTPPPTTNIFGAAAATTTTTSIFGGGGTTSSGIFGTPGTSSVFGTPTTSFGAPASSIFGGGFKPAVSTSASVFGQQSGGSVFNTPAASTSFGSTTAAASNVFGTPTSSAPFGSSGVFGTPTTGTGPFKSPDVFGSSQANSFSFPPASSSGFGFNKSSFGFGSTPGGNTESGSFNFGSLNVCSPTTTASGAFGSGFGQAQNPFGRTPNEEQKSPFGSGGSLFATTASTALGGSSPFNKSPTTAFGAPAAFGSPQGFVQQPTFGQPGFGSGSVFGGGGSQPGPFSGGAQSVGQTGFGSSAAFAKPPSGFGSPPAFGSTSPGAFGASPSFGGSPTFSSNAAFGGGSNVFGRSPSADTFGTTGQQNSTFANLANQQTLGFGNLAQQQSQTPTSQSTGFSGGSSFSTWR